jgi:hypothetical protein
VSEEGEGHWPAEMRKEGGSLAVCNNAETLLRVTLRPGLLHPVKVWGFFLCLRVRAGIEFWFVLCFVEPSEF